MVGLILVMKLLPNKDIIEEIATIRSMMPSFVEKDWFVTQIIAIISEIKQDGFEIIFSGGTSLSKAHKLLQRFSEDIDFRLIVSEALRNRKSLSNFKNLVVESIRKYGFSIKEEQIRARDENRFFSIELDYESYFPLINSLRPHIQIEITARNTQLPPIYLPVSSFIGEETKKPAEVAKIACIDPIESAADKLSAIAWRVPDRIRGDKYDDPAIVRHIYDLAMLKNKALASSNFVNLVRNSTNEDDNRPKNKALLGLGVADKFQKMLHILETDLEYPKEYELFVKTVSYARDASLPDFLTAVEAVKQLILLCKEL